jgi:ADP-heptose:LPS heptosyltransferase
MPEAVVIQWARLGDLLQTRILLRRLKVAGYRVTLCCDSRYSDLAACFPEVDFVWPIDLAAHNASAKQSLLPSSLLHAFMLDIDHRKHPPFECAFVLNHALAAAIFAELLQPVEIFGFKRRGANLSTPRWLEELEQRRKHGEIWPLHIADLWACLFTHDAGGEWLPGLPRDNSVSAQSSPCMGIFCDAGERYRTIPFLWLLDVANKMTDIGYRVRLFGKNATPLDASINQSSIEDYRGQTDYMQLMRMLASCYLVVGSDSGGLHLAAALGLPAVGLYFGGAHAVNTGPYASAARVIESIEWNKHSAHAISGYLQQLNAESSMRFESDSWHEFVPDLDELGLSYLPSDAGSSAYQQIALARDQALHAIQKSVPQIV